MTLGSWAKEVVVIDREADEANAPQRSLAEIRGAIRSRSPLPPQRTEEILAQRFGRTPKRLAFALERWPLATSAVLDVGCAHGHCLARFGPGSVGVDNVSEHVEICRTLGLEAILADANDGLASCPDSSFDYAWVSDIVEHLDAPRLVLRGIASKLRPEGALLLFVTTLPQSRLVRRALRRAHVDPFDAEAHHYQFTYDTARYVLERSGFRVMSVHVPGVPGIPMISALARRHAPRLFLEARPSAEAQRLARAAEQRNRA